MSEKRFIIKKSSSGDYDIYDNLKEDYFIADSSLPVNSYVEEIVDLLNEQQELIEELHISDHMGWGRAEKFEKELKQKKIYIKRLEYKVQKFKEMNNEQQSTINKLKSNIEETEISIKLFEDDVNRLQAENEQLKHWNKCLAEKRHNEKESNESLIKKLINKIDFLERIIDGDI